MTLLEGFRAFTLDAAYAEHLENSIGSLEPGKWADFILIDRDLFTIAPADIWRIRWSRPGWQGSGCTETDRPMLAMALSFCTANNRGIEPEANGGDLFKDLPAYKTYHPQ